MASCSRERLSEIGGTSPDPFTHSIDVEASAFLLLSKAIADPSSDHVGFDQSAGVVSKV